MGRRVRSGFTLIEILVVVTIMLILLGFGMSGFNNYSSQQRVKQIAFDFRNNLRLAQSKAMDGEKPPGAECVSLKGYHVSVTARTYTIGPVCDDGDGGEVSDFPEKVTVTASEGVSFSFVAPFRFKPMTNGITLNSNLIISVTGTTYQADVTVNKNGAVGIGYVGVKK